MDLYDSNNSTWIANLGCVSFNSNQAWSHTAPVNIELTGGSTYALRLTMRTQSTAGLSLAAVTTVGMDDVELNFAPVGVTVSQSGTHPQLSWTASVLGTGAPALHSTEAYEVARHTSSPVTTAHLIGHSTTTSYSDQTASGNTTYFYTLFDKDVNGTRSPASQEVSLLTKPVAPVDLNANTLSESSIGLSWQAPPGGAVTYKLQRAPDISGTPGTYIDLVSNHASTSYTDLSLNCSESYWYRVAGQNASGDGVYSSPVLGTTEYCISITLDSDGMVSFGVVPKNTMRNTTAGDLNDSEVVVPTHGPVDLSIKTTAFSSGDDHWSLASTPGHNAVKWQYSITGSEWFEFTQVDSYVPLVQNVSTPTPLFFQLSTPTTSDSLGPYSAGITILATRPD
jgi:hypothetical protein